jgi:hypothetical protein
MRTISLRHREVAPSEVTGYFSKNQVSSITGNLALSII